VTYLLPDNLFADHPSKISARHYSKIGNERSFKVRELKCIMVVQRAPRFINAVQTKEKRITKIMCHIVIQISLAYKAPSTADDNGFLVLCMENRERFINYFN